MPVARGPQINARSALVVGFTGVVIALLLGGMVLWVSSSGDAVTLQLGDAQFDAGFTSRQAEEIDARGPILYADLGTNGTRDIYVQHIGDDPDVGWIAFLARRAVDPRDCTLTWTEETRTFSLVSSSDQTCDPVTVDELGCGLQRFPVGVIDDKVIVFLNETQEEVDAALEASRDDSEPAPVGPDLSCPEE